MRLNETHVRSGPNDQSTDIPDHTVNAPNTPSAARNRTGGRVLRRRNQTHTAAAQSSATATGVLRPSTYPPERNENAATAAIASAYGTVFRAL